MACARDLGTRAGGRAESLAERDHEFSASSASSASSAGVPRLRPLRQHGQIDSMVGNLVAAISRSNTIIIVCLTLISINSYRHSYTHYIMVLARPKWLCQASTARPDLSGSARPKRLGQARPMNVAELLLGRDRGSEELSSAWPSWASKLGHQFIFRLQSLKH